MRRADWALTAPQSLPEGVLLSQASLSYICVTIEMRAGGDLSGVPIDDLSARALDAGWGSLKVRDLARVDLVWDGAQARVLEVDVSPSLAESSPFSLACEASGLSLSGVLNELVSQYAR